MRTEIEIGLVKCKAAQVVRIENVGRVLVQPHGSLDDLLQEGVSWREKVVELRILYEFVHVFLEFLHRFRLLVTLQNCQLKLC